MSFPIRLLFVALLLLLIIAGSCRNRAIAAEPGVQPSRVLAGH
jgi:hypothetical protein